MIIIVIIIIKIIIIIITIIIMIITIMIKTVIMQHYCHITLCRMAIYCLSPGRRFQFWYCQCHIPSLGNQPQCTQS